HNLAGADCRSWLTLDFQRHLQEAFSLRNNTVNGYLTALDHFLDFAGIKPLDKPIRPMQRERRVYKTLTPEQVVHFLVAARNCDSQKTKALALLLFSSAITAGECVNLNIDDVRLDGLSPHILVKSARGKKARMVKLNAASKQALYDWLCVRGSSIGDTIGVPLFVNDRDHKRLTASGLDSIIRHFGFKNFIEVSPRILRDTCMSNLASSRSAPRPFSSDQSSELDFFNSWSIRSPQPAVENAQGNRIPFQS
ncbi:MAG: tyrosine-type recombinase/integrase, partial [Cyanobacteria bacterium]|nr:tyrosine-type recombinase/integrase [Cyanobacteriota bacterium]